MNQSGPIRLRYPGGKQFAFTIFDDCDNSTIENTKPFYDFLRQVGMRTTKAVWCMDSPGAHSNWRGSSTLEDPGYRKWTQELQEQGFEIAFHGASMMSSRRDRVERGLDIFLETYGHYPRAYANHGSNQDNLYWFGDRFRSRLLRVLYTWRVVDTPRRSEGHVQGSPYFWGDLCRKHIEYVRGFTFPAADLFSVHRNVLYRDPATPFVNLWFSGSHAPDAGAFNQLLQPANQEKLRQEGGICIVATHGARDFCQDGVVNGETRRLLELLAEKDGWFVPVSTLLDYLRAYGFGQPIPWIERRAVELRWLLSAMRRGLGH